MTEFEEKFVQHLENSFYGLERDDNIYKTPLIARLLLMMAERDLPSNCDSSDIKAIMVPHAGLSYSGLCAASAYASVLGSGKNLNNIENIVLLGTRHSGNPGILVPNIDYFEYCGHKFQVNNDFYTEYNTTKGITMKNDNEFLEEHSLEIQMPFIWSLFVGKRIKYIPMLVGELTQSELDNISEILSRLNLKKTLWIITSDLMHVNGHHGYEINTNLTKELIKTESQMSLHFVKPEKSSAYSLVSEYRRKKPTICGIHALILWTAIAKNMNLVGKITSYYSSLHITDTNMLTKPKHSINQKFQIEDMFIRFHSERRRGSVSYLGLVYITQSDLQKYSIMNRLTHYEKYALHDFATRIIQHLLKTKPVDTLKEAYNTPPPFISGSYMERLGCFITFKNNGKLRGCIGNILYNDKEEHDIDTPGKDNKLLTCIIKNTVNAGFNDTRRGLTKDNPLTLDEFNTWLTIDINILGKPQLISEKKKRNVEIIDKWRLGIDGILLFDTFDGQSSIFLPSVPIDMEWDKLTTLHHLYIKAYDSSKKNRSPYKNEWNNPNINLYIIHCYEFSNL